MYDKDDPRCKRSGEPVIEAPSICPDCGSILVTNGEILQCINKSCPCRVKGRILNFCKKMNIKNISYAIIDTLYKEGILTDIKSLFSLDDRRDEIIKLDGFGDLKVNSFVDEINKISEIPASIVLGALGIEGVATKTFKSVLKYIHLDELLDICRDGNNEVLEVVPGVKSKTSAKIIDGIRESMSDIKYLMDVFDIVDDSNTKSDFTVVFTKFRDESLEDFVRDNGGEVVDSLTKTTDILVVPNEFTSSGKVDKAKKNGTAIVPKDKLKDYITDKYL
jgi:DNA ligase